MEVKFSDVKKSLDIRNLGRLKIITIEDYGKRYQDKIAFPPGAHHIEVILAREDDFSSISDFLIHVMSMRHANRINFNLPIDFFNQTYFLTKLSSDQFNLYVDSYFDGFFVDMPPISPNLDLWKVKLNINDYREGFKIEMSGTAQVLVCRTSIYYMHFVSQSID